MVGSIWIMYLQGFNFSVAVAVGLIALAGVAVETSIIMLQYLKQAVKNTPPSTNDANSNAEQLHIAVRDGALSRMRPIMMTAFVDIVGLTPIILGSGTGADMMSRIVAPMVGGMFSAVILTLIVLPAIFLLWVSYSQAKK